LYNAINKIVKMHTNTKYNNIKNNFFHFYTTEYTLERNLGVGNFPNCLDAAEGKHVKVTPAKEVTHFTRIVKVSTVVLMLIENYNYDFIYCGMKPMALFWIEGLFIVLKSMNN